MDSQVSATSPHRDGSPDLTALAKHDTGVEREVKRRMRGKNYTVAEGSSTKRCLVWLNACRQDWPVVARLYVTAVLWLAFIVLVMVAAVIGPPTVLIWAGVCAVVAAIFFFVPVPIPIPAPPSFVARALRKQVRLRQMAQRNGGEYVVAGIVGDQLFPPDANPIETESILQVRNPRFVFPPTLATTRFALGSPHTCEFGTMTTAETEEADPPGFLWKRKSEQAFYGQYIVFRTDQTFPHVVFVSKADAHRKDDILDAMDPIAQMPIDPAIDEVFTTYCGEGDERGLRLLLTDKVKQGLVSAGGWYNVEMVAGTLLFFQKDAADFFQPETWEAVAYIKEVVDMMFSPGDPESDALR